MNLEQELKTKIDALKDEDWNEGISLLKSGETERQKNADIIIDVNESMALRMMPYIGVVNALAFAGMSPEKIMIIGCGLTTDGAYIAFRIRNTTPWTYFAGANGKHRRLEDSTGMPAYHCTDFNLITSFPSPRTDDRFPS